MRYNQKVLEQVICPRCNADAQHRIEEHNGKHLVYFVCPMCRYRRYLRGTTPEEVKLNRLEKKYKLLLENTTNENQRIRIYGKLKLIRKKKASKILNI